MMEISKEKKEKKKRIVPIWVCILIFIGAFFAGMISKVAIKPAWSTKYTATWSEELGTRDGITDLPTFASFHQDTILHIQVVHQ